MELYANDLLMIIWVVLGIHLQLLVCFGSSSEKDVDILFVVNMQT